MAFNLNVYTTEAHGELCDKCKKPASAERPLLDMWTTGRSYDQRNFISLHEDCLSKAIAKAKQPVKEQP